MENKKYMQELEKYNEFSNITLKASLNFFKSNMDKKNKLLFDHLLKKLKEERILYRMSNNFLIIIKENPYFYFELYDDFSVDYISLNNKQIELKLRFKKDINLFIKDLRGGIKI